MTAPDPRLALLVQWLQTDLGRPVARIEVASADASFRRYFRAFDAAGVSLVVMDAPPDKEDIGPYLKVAALLESTGVHVPRIHAVDLERGFVLLEDLGSTPLLARLADPAQVEPLYGDALAALARIQVGGRAAARELAPYDAAALERELALMPEWFCGRHLQLPLDDADRALLQATFDRLIAEALAQPQVFVHRDYHSRNLMVTVQHNPGIIDFQDALAGPIGYDLVSLLKDCYVGWPRARVEGWVAAYRARLRTAGFAAGAGASDGEFLRWFDMIGVQRHIKVLGIFARLWYRDGKSGYLADLPLTLQYVREACTHYPELADFGRWLERRIVPVFERRNPAVLAAASAATPR
ncbi:MAG: phosphotransferase [Steroidobacteraceae bacterium]|nr:phosphotransferase [Nevskiaceae bacterium]MCP5360511.1 phosphotransferase [Nevskiaceae bacterium]MCP5472857.1 phosphotransferase [Nevskiaceae bacterium]